MNKNETSNLIPPLDEDFINGEEAPTTTTNHVTENQSMNNLTNTPTNNPTSPKENEAMENEAMENTKSAVPDQTATTSVDAKIEQLENVMNEGRPESQEVEEYNFDQLEEALGGEGALDEAINEGALAEKSDDSIGLDQLLKSGNYIGQPKFNKKAEYALRILKIVVDGAPQFILQSVNIPISLNAQIKVEGEPTPKLINKMLFWKPLLGWIDKKTGLFHINTEGVSNLKRFSAAWLAANTLKEDGTYMTASEAYTHIAKMTPLQLVVNVLHRDPDEEAENFMVIPISRYTKKEQYKKDEAGNFIIDEVTGNKVVAYEATEVNDLKSAQYKTMVNANELMEDLSA